MNDDFGNSKQDSGPPNANGIDALTQERATKTNAIEISSSSIPKGCRAIKGIEDQFQLKVVTSTFSLYIPIQSSPSRKGFMPPLMI